MGSIPKIIVQNDIDQEVNVFYSFLHHQYYPANRTKIFKVFPALEERLGKTQDEKDEKIKIRSFLSEFYTENKDKVGEIIRQSRELFDGKSDLALKALSDLMSYEWQEPVTYIAIPTILPFSPFNNNTFYFSILSELKGNKFGDKNSLSIGIHEISHFVFFKQIEQLKKDGKIPEIPKETTNYLKESLAAVLLNESPLQEILGIKNYKGNPELWELCLKTEDGSIISLNDQLKKFYQKITKQERKSFLVFVEEVIKFLQPYNQAFEQKWKLWCQMGVSKDQERETLKSLYSKPI